MHAYLSLDCVETLHCLVSISLKMCFCYKVNYLIQGNALLLIISQKVIMINIVINLWWFYMKFYSRRRAVPWRSLLRIRSIPSSQCPTVSKRKHIAEEFMTLKGNSFMYLLHNVQPFLTTNQKHIAEYFFRRVCNSCHMLRSQMSHDLRHS